MDYNKVCTIIIIIIIIIIITIIIIIIIIVIIIIIINIIIITITIIIFMITIIVIIIIIIIIAIIKIISIIININRLCRRLLYLESFLFLHFMCTGLLFVRQVFIKIFELLQMLHVVFHLTLKFLIYFRDSENKQNN